MWLWRLLQIFYREMEDTVAMDMVQTLLEVKGGYEDEAFCVVVLCEEES